MEAQFFGPAFLGPRVLRLDTVSGRGSDPRVHQESGERGRKAGATRPVEMSNHRQVVHEMRGRVSDPFRPLRAARIPNAPGLAGGWLLRPTPPRSERSYASSERCPKYSTADPPVGSGLSGTNLPRRRVKDVQSPFCTASARMQIASERRWILNP